MARRYLSTIIQFILELVMIAGVLSLAYIATRVSEDGIEFLIMGAYMKVHN